MRFVSSYFLICLLCCITLLTACSYVAGNSANAPSIGSGSGSNQSLNSFSILVNNGNNPRVEQSITITVTALKSNGQTATSFSGPLSVLTSDGAATFPSSISLVNGVGTFTMTFNTMGPQSLIIRSDSIPIYLIISVTVLSSEVFGSLGWINAYSPFPSLYTLNPSNLCSDLTSSILNIAAPRWCSGAQTTPNSDGFINSYNTTVDPSGTYLYVADGTGRRIKRIIRRTGVFAGYIGDSSTAGSPANGLPGCVIGVQAGGWCAGGSFISSTKNGGFSNPRGIASDANSLYITDFNNNAVYKFDRTTGLFIGAIGKKNSASGTCQLGAQLGWCVAADPNPAMFATAIGGGDGQFNLPSGIALSGGGYIYITSENQAFIQRFDLNGAYMGSIGRLTGAAGTVVPGGSFVNACPASAIVTPEWCSGGTFNTSNINGALDGAFSQVAGITADDHYLYIADYGLSRVDRYQIYPESPLVATFKGSIGYISSSVNTGTGTDVGRCANTAGATNSWCTGGIFTFIEPTPDGAFANPLGITLDSAHDLLYLADNGNGSLNSRKVTRLKASTGQFLGSIGLSSTTANVAKQLPFTNPDSSPGVQCNTSSTQLPNDGWCYGGYFTAGNGDGQFNRPFGVYYSDDPIYPALFVADYAAGAVVKIHPTGKISP